MRQIPSTPKLITSPYLNLDGDAQPDLIICHDNGNAGNGYTLYSLGLKAKVLGEITAWRYSAKFVDVDRDGRCEVLARDTTFYGWKACNACSPMPIVVLKMKDSRLVMAPELMRGQAPSLVRQKDILRDWTIACRPDGLEKSKSIVVKNGKVKVLELSPMVWSDMLSLIYTGNSQLAFRLLDRFWPADVYTNSLEMGGKSADVYTSKKRFIGLFLNQLSYSPYLKEIQQLNIGDNHLSALKRRPYFLF